jgi:hypothetical protein
VGAPEAAICTSLGEVGLERARFDANRFACFVAIVAAAETEGEGEGRTGEVALLSLSLAGESCIKALCC